MTTTRSIVESALKRVRVVGLGEDASGDYATHVLGSLNDMMHGWAFSGVDIKHTDLALSDTFWFPVPPKGIDADAIAAMAYQGTWNASTNSPSLTTATGTQGYYYRVSTAGSTTLDDVTSWTVDGIAIFDGSAWLKGPSSRMFEGGVIDMLARDIAEDFGVDLTRKIVEGAADGWLAIQAHYVVPRAASFDTGLVRTTARRYDELS